jgi:hypothetical protein
LLAELFAIKTLLISGAPFVTVRIYQDFAFLILLKFIFAKMCKENFSLSYIPEV